MVRIKTLPKGIRLYHGTNPPNAKDFESLNAQGVLEKLLEKSRKEQNAHWGNSLYLSYDESVSLGYINQNDETGFIIELEVVEDLGYIRSCDEIFASGQCGSHLPENIKKEVECLIRQDVGQQMFMNYLGKHKYAFECFHDLKHRVELIVPSNLIYKFKVVSITPVQYSWKAFEYIKGTTISKNED